MHPTAPASGSSRSRSGRGDAEPAVAGEAVGQHAAVARLEDVQRKRRAGKEDDGEGEEREPNGMGKDSGS